MLLQHSDNPSSPFGPTVIVTLSESNIRDLHDGAGHLRKRLPDGRMLLVVSEPDSTHYTGPDGRAREAS